MVRLNPLYSCKFQLGRDHQIFFRKMRFLVTCALLVIYYYEPSLVRNHTPGTAIHFLRDRLRPPMTDCVPLRCETDDLAYEFKEFPV